MTTRIKVPGMAGSDKLIEQLEMGWPKFKKSAVEVAKGEGNREHNPCRRLRTI